MKDVAEILTKQKAIDEIVKEAKKLDEVELQVLLTRLRVKKLLKDKRKPIADYDGRKLKPASMDEIDAWKHEARKHHANK